MSTAPTNDVNFWRLLAPEQSVEQQKIDRQRALAEALRTQSLQDDVPQRGAYSWTQAAAKLAQALSANVINRRADKEQVALNQGYAAALKRRVSDGYGTGSNPDGTMSLAGNGNGLAPAASAGTAPSSVPAQRPEPFAAPRNTGQASEIPGDVPDNAVPAVPQAGAMSTAQPDAAPPAVAQATNIQQPMPSAPIQPASAWSYTGNPEVDYTLAAGMGIPAYLGKVAEAHAPTDYIKTVIARRDAAARGDWQMVNELTSQLEKQNYIAPVNGRPGSTIRDPLHPERVIGYDAPNIENAFPVYGPDGMPTGYRTAPGANAALQAAAGAKAAGSNSFEPISGFDEAGNPVFTNKTAAAQGGAMPGGGVVRPGLRPGLEEASKVTGTESAKVFQQISDMGADVPNRINALRQMAALANDPKTILGPGSNRAAELKGYFGTIAQSWGGQAPTSVTNAVEFNKWASQYAARTAQELGLSGSDARVQIAVHASPNGEMTRDALRSVIPQFMGMELAKQGYANAAVAWQQTHGPDTAQQFRTAWNRSFDPRLYVWQAEGPQSLAGHMKSLSKDDAIALRSKYVMLKQIGAI